MSEETFLLRVNCLIVAAFKGPEVYDTTVALNPVGTDLTFPADGMGWANFMGESIGKIASVMIYCPSANITATDIRETQFDAFYSGDPDEEFMKRGFRAVGQIIGYNKEDWAINSTFPFLAFNDDITGFEPSFLGQWVEVRGMIWADWKPHDVISLTSLEK